MVKKEKARRRLRSKLDAGGPKTHGDLLDAIYKKHPKLFKKSCRIARKRRERLLKEQSFIKKAAICNEFGSRLMKNSHSHMYVQTEQKYTFQVFKKLFYKKFGLKINDIRRPVKLCECIRYVTKEDRQAIIYNVPMKFTSTVYRAANYFQEVGSATIRYGDYIPSCVSACDRKVFESVLAQGGQLQVERSMHDRVQNLKLLKWQQTLIN